MIKRQIVPASRARRVTYSGTNSRNYIVIHETANESIGADAQTHANLQSQGFSASWHYQVDDKLAIQSFEDTAQTWHAGSAKYNRDSIGIEICVNRDGDYNKAVDNAIELVKHLMKRHNISIMNVIPHQKTSTWNKECPRYLLRGRYITWNQFINRLKGDSKVSVSKQTTAPNKPKQSTSAPKTGSVVDYLNAQGISSSFANRKKLASKYGIGNYKGTASQNTRLLNAIKGGKPKPTVNKANIAVDGKAGPALVRAIQVATGSKFKDGVFSGQPRNSVTQAFYGGISYGSGGSPSVGLLQRKVGAKVDNLLGPATIRSLQRYLGTPQDGVISRPNSLVIRRLQERLNNGTF